MILSNWLREVLSKYSETPLHVSNPIGLQTWANKETWRKREEGFLQSIHTDAGGDRYKAIVQPRISEGGSQER